MNHQRSLAQRLSLLLFNRLHRPPDSGYKTGDQVGWAGVDGVVVSVTGDQVQSIFPLVGAAPIVVKFSLDGAFFGPGSLPSLAFIRRPPITTEIPANVTKQVSAEAPSSSTDLL